MPDETPQPADALPTATLAPARLAWWVWLIPLAALAAAGALVAHYVVKRGPLITLTMHHGYGVKPTDAVRCRGIAVGEVERVRLADTLDGVVVDIRLEPTAADLARQGARFWIVRPRFGVGGVAGLETVAGPRYIAVLPGRDEAPRTNQFTALEDPPPVEQLDPEGLRITLVADRRGSLRPGAPVLYRQFTIGTVLSADLAANGQQVEIAAYIEPRYVHVIRLDTQFANVSGLAWTFGLQGARVEVESLQSLLDGGIAAFTPAPAKRMINDGKEYEFKLHPRPEDKWYEWQPDLGPSPSTTDAASAIR